jgi:dolichol-phosphate mannosyltransferase
MLCCVVPVYRARATLAAVIAGILPYADRVIVVDDACPESSCEALQAAFGAHPNVEVVTRERNGGVGAAMKSGLERALECGADIIVKIDADGQMDPSYLPEIARIFAEHPEIGYIKGNRFVSETLADRMPAVRLFGNAMLSLFVKLCSGYWNLLDPTNGYVAFNAAMLRELPYQQFADSYFFEISVLGALGLRQVPVAELEMPAIYGTERSSLAIHRVLLEFPRKLLALTLRRVWLQYFLFDVNLGSLYIVFGALLTIAGLVLGGAEWIITLQTGHARTAGTVMLAVIPILLGIQLLSNALMYDVQFMPKVIRERRMSPKSAGERSWLRRLG